MSPAEVLLLASVFVVAACGLVYELAAGSLASYLLGDSVLQFSTIIGAYLFAMGVGSWLSRYFDRQLPAHFLRIELMVALIGGVGAGLAIVVTKPKRGGRAGSAPGPAGGTQEVLALTSDISLTRDAKYRASPPDSIQQSHACTSL